METKKNIFSNGPEKKGGKDSTRIVLTAAGATVVGAGAAMGINEALKQDDQEKENPEQTNGQEAQHQETQQEAQQANQQASQQQTSQQSSNEPQPVDSSENQATNPEPVDNNDMADNSNAGGNENGGDVNLDDVDVDQIAQEITAVEVDPNDVDMADIIQVDDVDTLYFEDGSEMQVASIHTPDGGEYMMVDVDNDMTFDVITDLEGNPIAQVDSNLTYSDVEDMMDETGGELAYVPDRDDQELANGEDPEEGIVDTLVGMFDDEEDVAENREDYEDGEEEANEEEDDDDLDIAEDDDAEDDLDSVMEDDLA